MTSTHSNAGPWPNGARAAIAFTIDNMGEAAELNRNLWPKNQTIGSHYSVTAVLPKILRLLEAAKVQVTYFVESWNLAIYPQAIKDITSAGHEIGWHAWQHQAWGKYVDENEEREDFRRSFGDDGLAGFVVKEGDQLLNRYRGFRPPGGLTHGQRTLKLCREYGLDYISPAGDHAALIPLEKDDQIVVLPFRWKTVDAYYYMEAFAGLRKIKGSVSDHVQPPEVVVEKMKREIDSVIETGGYLSVLFHPFLNDGPERLQALELVVQYLVEKRDKGEIWLTRCMDVAAWVKKHPHIVGDDPQWDTTQWTR